MQLSVYNVATVHHQTGLRPRATPTPPPPPHVITPRTFYAHNGELCSQTEKLPRTQRKEAQRKKKEELEFIRQSKVRNISMSFSDF